MNASSRRSFLRQVFFISWGMATLVLVFCIGILVYEMIQKGQNPLELTEEEPLPEARNGELPADTVATTEEVLLFFSDAQGNQLIAEPRRIEFTDSTAENCRNALNALIAGPQETGTVWPVVSPGVKVQALYLLEGGELVIDFSRELFEEHKNVQSASFEALLVYGIVQTLTQDAVKGPKDQAVSRVRFLMEGAPPPFPAHLDVSSPIAPDRRWVAAPAV